jgi:uncharacterized membrane protein
MYFAAPLPWWLVVVVGAAIAAVAYGSYRASGAPLTRGQRGTLSILRAATLAAIVLFLCRPTLVRPDPAASDAVVPVLVDVSSSMRVADAGGRPRFERAVDLLRAELLPAVSRDFRTELYAVGESVTPSTIDAMAAEARQSNLIAALDRIRERYSNRHVPGIVVLSDGGDTSQRSDLPEGGPPVFPIGFGSADGPVDREVTGLTASDLRLDQASVDLHVSAVSHGLERSPLQLRILANGQLVESRTVVPARGGSPVEELFTVSPDPRVATVYTAEVVRDRDESIAENNARSVLVRPVGRKRRVLALAGAPGYEFSFMARALARDPGIEVDAVVRKGRNETGDATFLVQAGSGRASALMAGFPSSREALYAYDALIIANIEGDFFTRGQLAMTAEFVSARGGGVLVLGGRSFAERGLIGTPLEEVLPIELNDRRGAVVEASYDGEGAAAQNAVLLTAEGEAHPVMRIAGSREDTRKRWSGLPPLAGLAALGGPRPGASVLAVTIASSGGTYPLVAVQRYGRGRSMVFTGEASWRWRMLTPSTDRTYEYFWRQATRWLAARAPDPVSVSAPESAEPGDAVPIEVNVLDSAFVPIADAEVRATITTPGADPEPLPLRREAGTGGRYVATLRPDRAGLHRVRVDARRGTAPAAAADEWFYVGGTSREFADPRLNEALLQRIARASGGQYIAPERASGTAELLRSAVLRNPVQQRVELWHQPWAYALVVALLAAEWILRRRWGLR